MLAGTAAATETFAQLDPAVRVEWHLRDGDAVLPGQALGDINGSLRSVLGGERTALNLLQHCSGIATITRRYVRAARGKARIRDTRKTLPGLRALEKAAVRAGGGFNHRESLSDAVLIKDNHLAHLDLRQAVGPGPGPLAGPDHRGRVRHARPGGRSRRGPRRPRPARQHGARAGAAKRSASSTGRSRVEVSGRISLETIGAYAQAGVDYISVGAITHSAPALDIALDLD